MVRVTERPALWELSPTQWEAWLKAQGQPPYRARQIESWLWGRALSDPRQMSNLPASLRSLLEENFRTQGLKLLHRHTSRDGTQKFLWQMPEGGTTETVWIPHRGRHTVCVSSQVGCSLNCRFCATGQLGLERQLKGYEIALQVATLKGAYPLPVSHVVFMGMGEPLLNYSALIEAIELLTTRIGLSARRLTVSTVGVPKAIRRLAELPQRIELAFSLHSALSEKRRELIPLAAHIPLDDIREALIYFCQQRREWVTLEYVLLDGINDSPEDAEALRDFVAPPLLAKVNLIVYNPVPGLPFRPSQRIEAFQQQLLRRGLLATVRQSRGADIAAGCGQLARQKP